MSGPHAGQPVLTAGRPASAAPAAVVLVHGRGADAEDILGLVPELDRPDLAYLAPEAAGRSWYPFRFLEPLDQNEPWLSSGLAVLGELLAGLSAAGIGADRTVLLGFSQGACLALELAARAPPWRILALAASTARRCCSVAAIAIRTSRFHTCTRARGPWRRWGAR